MIDGIKLFFSANEAEINNLKSIFNFSGSYSTQTGEVFNQRLTAYYRHFTISITANHNVTIQGSLHKSFNRGINYDFFTHSQLKNAVDTISAELNIDASRIKIQRIEAGVNVRFSPITYESIEHNAIMYKFKPFGEYKIQRLSFGIYAEQQRYTLKIYNKSKQEHLPFDLIRFELKIVKSEHLKPTGIKTLDDLKNKSKMDALGLLMNNHFKDILMDNYREMAQCKLTSKELKLYLQGNNPQYWKRLKCDSSKSTVTSRLRSFKLLIKNHANVVLTDVIVNTISYEWQHLLSN